MRKSVVVLAFFLCLGGMLNAQDKENIVAEGDIIVLGKPNGSDYRHIDFPRKNIIVKRGAIANFNALIGKRLVVQSLEIDKDGVTEAVLTRKDGMNFFRFFPKVRADIEQAIETGELQTINYKGQGAIVQD